jgi:hypothetical protein
MISIMGAEKGYLAKERGRAVIANIASPIMSNHILYSLNKSSALCRSIYFLSIYVI